MKTLEEIYKGLRQNQWRMRAVGCYLIFYEKKNPFIEQTTNVCKIYQGENDHFDSYEVAYEVSIVNAENAILFLFDENTPQWVKHYFLTDYYKLTYTNKDYFDLSWNETGLTVYANTDPFPQ